MFVKQDLLDAIKCTMSIDCINKILEQIDDINYGTTDCNGDDPNPIIALGHYKNLDNYKCQILQLLLLKGANVNTIASNTGSTPIMYYAQRNNLECVKLLMQKNPNRTVINKFGLSLKDYCESDEILKAVEDDSKIILNRLRFLITNNVSLQILELELGEYDLTIEDANILLFDCISKSKDNNREEIYNFLIDKGASFEKVRPRLIATNINMTVDKMEFLKSKGIKISYLDEGITMETCEYLKICGSFEQLTKTLLDKEKLIQELRDTIEQNQILINKLL